MLQRAARDGSTSAASSVPRLVNVQAAAGRALQQVVCVCHDCPAHAGATIHYTRRTQQPALIEAGRNAIVRGLGLGESPGGSTAPAMLRVAAPSRSSAAAPKQQQQQAPGVAASAGASSSATAPPRRARINRQSSPATAAPSKPAPASTLTSAAIQDHLLRTLAVGLPGAAQRAPPSNRPGAPLTLAQHLGLIPRPPALLTQQEWADVHLKARARQHSTSECPICQEGYSANAPQVLLSCSHVFHASCLASFERYARVRCCPL
jgi:hypothetical protein